MIGCFLNILVGTRLYRGRVPRLKSDDFTCCHTGSERGDNELCLSRSNTDTDAPSREWGSNPRLLHHELRALPSELQGPMLLLQLLVFNLVFSVVVVVGGGGGGGGGGFVLSIAAAVMLLLLLLLFCSLCHSFYYLSLLLLLILVLNQSLAIVFCIFM